MGRRMLEFSKQGDVTDTITLRVRLSDSLDFRRAVNLDGSTHSRVMRALIRHYLDMSPGERLELINEYDTDI